jgi:hypothetical protein
MRAIELVIMILEKVEEHGDVEVVFIDSQTSGLHGINDVGIDLEEYATIELRGV